MTSRTSYPMKRNPRRSRDLSGFAKANCRSPRKRGGESLGGGTRPRHRGNVLKRWKVPLEATKKRTSLLRTVWKGAAPLR
jgi:hypothetical protein